MAGGTGTTMKVSAALRRAGLPVIRYGIGRGLTGIYVSNMSPTRTGVSLRYSQTDPAGQQEAKTADDIEAVLRAHGFPYARHTIARPGGRTAYSFTVYATREDPLYQAHLATQAAPEAAGQPETPAEPEQAAIAASGLPVRRSTHKDWLIEHDGHRDAYHIERTGGSSRARYTVTTRGGSGRHTIAKNLRDMTAALDAVQADIAN